MVYEYLLKKSNTKMLQNCVNDWKYRKYLRKNFSQYVNTTAVEEHTKHLNHCINVRLKLEKQLQKYSGIPIEDIKSDYQLFKKYRILTLWYRITKDIVSLLENYEQKKEIGEIVKNFSYPGWSFCQLMDKVILPTLGISSPNDISNIKMREAGPLPQSIDDLSMVGFPLFAAFKKQQEVLHKLLQQETKTFFYAHLTNNYLDYLPFMACIFPKRYIVTPNDIIIAHEAKISDTDYTIKHCIHASADFIYQYFNYKELFQKELITILPQMITLDPSTQYASAFSIAPYNKNGNIIITTPLGHQTPDPNSSMLFTSTEWIQNLHINDYNELTQKYPTEFNQFQIKLDKLLLETKRCEDLPSIIIKEYNEASLEIKSIMLKKAQDMKRVGKEAILGTILTALPIAMKAQGFNYFDTEYISSVVGGATIYNSIKDFYSIRNIERQHPFWILWKWVTTSQ